MAYLRGHWEHNFNRYQSWLQRQAVLKAAQAEQEEIQAKQKQLRPMKRRKEKLIYRNS